MTRRLGGPNKGLAAIASLSLAATLACVGAITGCGSSSSQTQPGDSGMGTNFDAGEDSPTTNTPDTGVITPVVDAAPPLPVCGTPTISPNGGAVTIGSTVTITGATGFPSTGNIFFTTDGTAPTHTSQLYSGPIQLSQNETIHAIAYASGTCTDSGFATAMFTVSLGDGGITLPIFNPPSTTENNNFLVSLSDGASSSSGVTICFTTDGSTTPTCTVTGTAATCGAGSTTYNAGAGLNAAGSVSITPAITNATTGVVSIQAVACAVGAATTAVAKQQYTLQVANPTMQGPAAGNLPYVPAGYAPTAGSVTTGASIRYTTDGSTVTCNTGTLLQTGLGVAQNPGNPPLTQNTTFSVIGCEPGYAPSTPESFPYTITLNPPALITAAGTYDSTFSAGFTTSATSNSGVGGVYYCSSTTVSEPACGTAAGTCTTGTAGAASVTTTGTTVAGVACAPNFNGSAPTTATYTLQLSPPAISPPGCVLAAGGHGDCRNSTGATTPDLSVVFPGGPFDVEQSPGLAVNVPPGATSATIGAYAFACAIKGTGAPSCGTATCTAGTSVGPTAGQSFTVSPGVPFSNAALTIAAGDSWTVVGCPGSNTAFAQSAPTTVTFSLPGQALAPSISPATGTVSSNSLTATITNQDPTSTVICASTTATAPTCASATTCTNPNSASFPSQTVTPFGAATVTHVNVQSGGSGYATAPTVTIAPPGSGTQAIATANLGFSVASITFATPGSGCSASPTGVTFTIAAPPPTGATIQVAGTTATVTGTTVSGASNSLSTITVAGGSGYGAVPAVTYTGGCTVAPTGLTAVLSTTGSVNGFTIANHGSGYSTAPAVTLGGNATATAVLDDSFTVPNLNTNTETLTAVTCGGQTSPPATATYGFQLANPDVTQGATNLDNGGAVIYGSTVAVTTTTTTLATEYICATTNGSTPNCTCTPGTGILDSRNGPIAPAITAATTIKAIACDSSGTNTWTQSGVTSSALTIAFPVPTLSPAGGTYENVETVSVSNFGSYPPATTFCYTPTAGSTPTCTAGACTGGSQTYNNGTGITVGTTGTELTVIACTSTQTSGSSAGDTYTLNVTPVVVLSTEVSEVNTPLSCATNNVTIGLDCSVTGGVCSTATVAAGGPTPNAEFCWSTTSTVTGCPAVPPAGVHCSVVGSPPPAAPLTVTENTTISTASCVPGSATVSFNTISGPLTVAAPATFTFTPIIDGSLADWTAAAGDGTALATAANVGTIAGYFGYDAANYYFAYSGVTGAGAAAPTTFVTIYMGNAGSTTGGTTALIAPDTCTTAATVLPSGINAEYAFTVETDNDAVTAYTWNVAGASWTPAGYAVTAKSAGANIEISVAKTSLGGITQPNVLGALVTNVGQTNCGAANPAGAIDTWPAAPAAFYGEYAQANTASCQAPNANIE